MALVCDVCLVVEGSEVWLDVGCRLVGKKVRERGKMVTMAGNSLDDLFM
jgi:hypothetical protein